jgi:hypothetical protein
MAAPRAWFAFGLPGRRLTMSAGPHPSDACRPTRRTAPPSMAAPRAWFASGLPGRRLTVSAGPHPRRRVRETPPHGAAIHGGVARRRNDDSAQPSPCVASGQADRALAGTLAPVAARSVRVWRGIVTPAAANLAGSGATGPAGPASLAGRATHRGRRRGGGSQAARLVRLRPSRPSAHGVAGAPPPPTRAGHPAARRRHPGGSTPPSLASNV